jgi:hypothetical protein
MSARYDWDSFKKYLALFLCAPLANYVWGWWVLPGIGEEGSPHQILVWLSVQAILPALLLLLVLLKSRLGHRLTLVYSIFILLHGVGMLGWGLIGPGTPLSLYTACLILLTMGFGLLYRSLKSLGIGRKQRRYDFENE